MPGRSEQPRFLANNTALARVTFGDVTALRFVSSRFEDIFAAATGQSQERIAQDTQRDFWLTTEAALDYGLVHKVIRSVDDLG